VHFCADFCTALAKKKAETNTHGQPKNIKKKGVGNRHTTLGFGFFFIRYNCHSSKKWLNSKEKHLKIAPRNGRRLNGNQGAGEGGLLGGTSAQYKLTRVFHLNVFAPVPFAFCCLQ